MKKRIISLAAAAVFVIGTLAGCGNSSTQTTDTTASSDASSSSGDLVTVRDAVMTGQLDQYATEIGLWQGIFEKYGIDLQTTEFVAGINTIDAVVNGTADIGMMADYAAVNRLGNTLDATNLQIFSQISGGQAALSGGLYVDPKYADDPKSLDGSAGFMYQEGTVTYYYASKCIEYLGLDESKQNLINTDSSQTRLALIQKDGASAVYANGSEGNTVGYYYPGGETKTDSGNTIILTHENVYNHEISDKKLIDDKIIEVDWEGNILWSWRASDHFEEFDFDEAAKNVLFRNPGLHGEAGGDWMHINCVSVLGENKWYDAGDERFHPDNLIFDARNANILAIISKKTGEIVWQIGPDFSKTKELRKLGWIIGQHHFHMIPKGLPGEGNLLVFDNGGEGGYGNPNPSAPTGNNNAHRDYSRVLEFDPITLEIIWQYTPLEAGNLLFTDASKFYSSYISSAQRLPNGNTLITEGSDGHLIEVIPEHEIVWEYVNPYFKNIGGNFKMNMVYRAYRTPYEWVPQATHAEEVSIEPLDVETFRVPGASKGAGTGKVTVVAGVDPNRSSVTGMNGDDEDSDEERLDFCVASVKKGDLKEE